MNKKPELLAPAGNMEKLKAAFYFGADAVYCGGKDFSLRAFSDNFTRDGLVDAVKLAHGQGKKIYVASNIFARNSDGGELADYFAFLQSAGVDAAIISDLGVLSICRKTAPNLAVHISTQANTINKYAAMEWRNLGAKRIILARELSVEEIAEIREFLPTDTELEAFVHGAMCISYSGRCLISNYLSGRDGNRGECVQACRWEYAFAEKGRTGEPLTLQEDGRGSYILNSKDLCMVRHLDKLAAAGISSFKIEGRMKTAYYVATAVNAYRRAIDGRGEIDALENELYKTSHRKFTTGFYFGSDGTVNLDTSKTFQTHDFVGVVLDYDAARGVAIIEQRNRFRAGDLLEILSPSDSFNKVIPAVLTDENGITVADAFRVQQRLYLKTEIALAPGDILRSAVKFGVDKLN